VLLVVGVALLVLLAGGYFSWVAGRHERLAARADASWAALDAQLVRRAAPARSLAVLRGPPDLARRAEAALVAGIERREDAENALGRGLRRAGYAGNTDLPHLTPAEAAALRDLQMAAGRVQLARQFHNDAVRDLLALRRRWPARLMRLGRDEGNGPGRAYFEIDDTVAVGSQAHDTVAPKPRAAPGSGSAEH
jgi:hypothetical protein